MPIERSKIHSTVKIFHPELVNIYDSEIGEGTKIASFVEIGGAKIGSRCKIEAHVFIPRGTVIEDYVFVGPNTTVTNDKYPDLLKQWDDWEVKPVTIKRGAVIGANAVIVAGVTIGEEANIAAGAIVTKDVAPKAKIKGIPARPY
jgi:acetyltransferase-like isoleucine patch superfamily enzyme